MRTRLRNLLDRLRQGIRNVRTRRARPAGETAEQTRLAASRVSGGSGNSLP